MKPRIEAGEKEGSMMRRWRRWTSPGRGASGRHVRFTARGVGRDKDGSGAPSWEMMPLPRTALRPLRTGGGSGHARRQGWSALEHTHKGNADEGGQADRVPHSGSHTHA